MVLIQYHFNVYLIFIFLLIHKTDGIYSIQCCTGDNTCSSKPVDCSLNICFKLVINRETEERGCLEDLLKLLNSSRTFFNGNELTSGTSNDQCHRLGTSAMGMSLCKCTSHLCNSSSKIIYSTKPVLILFILSLQYFLRVFLS